MPGIKTIYRSINKHSLQSKSDHDIRKLMVIVDEQHLDMLDELMIRDKWDVQVVYILTDSPVVRSMFHDNSRIYPLRANIRSLLRFDTIDDIVCCTSSLSDEYLHELVEICKQFGVFLLLRPEQKNLKVPVSGFMYMADFIFYVLETNPGRRFGFLLKSIVEKSFAYIALLLLSPFLIIIAVLIKATSRGPVFFKQQRVGLRGRKFYIYKFRTMVADAEKQKAALACYNETDGPAFKIAKDPRITRVGRILRKTGLDEVPQLINVLEGEMSLIGPRPMLPGEVLAQDEWHLKRLCIKPGITCLWQIQPHRNKVPFERWMQLDREYVENWSIGTDMKIFLGTIRSVIAAKGL
ncbi:MAG: exopolysaccharide biosynthesis polyprenyl glycosylphosphotransferase [Bacteroidales bacterium]|nr:exopolysaccharide biosynthesis polyprenyl glycosylphosphotransferase [Bacteroidales bacterium]